MTGSERRDEGARGDGDFSEEAVDRAFAELVAGYHLTAEPLRPELGDDPAEDPARPGRTAEPETFSGEQRAPGTRRPAPQLDSRWADEHPLFSFPAEPPPEPEPEESYDPGPPPPWPRPSAAVLVGWIAVVFALLVMIGAALGAPVPRWMGWTAVGAFVGGFALLLSRLPRTRPPGSGDGAVL
ncbi:hypothetical protein FHX74_001960 [Friedmanniella endophytica]|uniref:Uncharacterized protein n=1 Tax=Microlunatus kandeliicorticis TaxID=1759536 RepID=A0A7W3P5T4_9ACTN|nr:hypothetical protein [Microlunatus kandeliicorticis]MBA8794341.1 hypothetical protein [Microlunatus kandeliicorticis]